MAAAAAEVAAVVTEVAAAAAEMATGAAEDGAIGDLEDTDAMTGRDFEGTDGVTGRDLEAMAGDKAGCFGPGSVPAVEWRTVHSWQCPIHQKEEEKTVLFLMNKTQSNGAGCRALRV